MNNTDDLINEESTTKHGQTKDHYYSEYDNYENENNNSAHNDSKNNDY